MCGIGLQIWEARWGGYRAGLLVVESLCNWTGSRFYFLYVVCGVGMFLIVECG